jgi:hypothetical protein
MQKIYCFLVPTLLIEAMSKVHLEVRLSGVQGDRLAEPPLGDNVRAHLQEVHADVILVKAGEQNRPR